MTVRVNICESQIKKYFYFTDFFAKIYSLLTHIFKTPPLRSHYTSYIQYQFQRMHNFSGKADSLIACYQENIWEGLIVGYKSKLIKQQNISGKGDLAYISTTLKFRNTQSNLNPYLSNLDQTASQGKTYRIKTFFQNSEKYRLSHWQTLSMKPRIHLV